MVECDIIVPLIFIGDCIMAKSLVFFFDGTRNYSRDAIDDEPSFSDNGGGGTNVWKWKCITDTAHHVCKYVGGVGNTYENCLVGELFGGAFGAGV